MFRQFFELQSSTYTYLLACLKTRKAIIIDPVLETVDRDSLQINQLGLNLIYSANTHAHADHITGSGRLKKLHKGSKSLISAASRCKADLHVEHGHFIQCGQLRLEVRATPGHTDGCVSYVDHETRCAFTGDALLIRGCGRTDFQQGSSERLYESVHAQILSLPDDYLLFPAHDYKGMTVTTVGEEKKYNARLTKSKEEFIHIMNNLNLPYPKQIDEAVPANIECGIFE